eukprot:31034-Pelagococcus_subviridis.AAC.11
MRCSLRYRTHSFAVAASSTTTASASFPSTVRDAPVHAREHPTQGRHRLRRARLAFRLLPVRLRLAQLPAELLHLPGEVLLLRARLALLVRDRLLALAPVLELRRRARLAVSERGVARPFALELFVEHREPRGELVNLARVPRARQLLRGRCRRETVALLPQLERLRASLFLASVVLVHLLRAELEVAAVLVLLLLSLREVLLERLLRGVDVLEVAREALHVRLALRRVLRVPLQLLRRELEPLLRPRRLLFDAHRVRIFLVAVGFVLGDLIRVEGPREATSGWS